MDPLLWKVSQILSTDYRPFTGSDYPPGLVPCLLITEVCNKIRNNETNNPLFLAGLAVSRDQQDLWLNHFTIIPIIAGDCKAE